MLVILEELEGEEEGEIIIDDTAEIGEVYSPPAHTIDPSITSMSTLPVSTWMDRCMMGRWIDGKMDRWTDG